MTKKRVSSIPVYEYPLWEKLKRKRALVSFDYEITARCNSNCRHCYINLDANDKEAQAKELSLEQIDRFAEEAASLGALWCLLTGGEPLLRRDFHEIYMMLKRKGLLVSLFTNATLITEEHIRLFKSYSPRDIEVSVYGITQETYERVTRRKGSFNAFLRGLNLLLDNGMKVRLKAVIFRSNVHEFPEILRFCEEGTKDFFRFDPFLHLRYDGDKKRNREIISERLSTSEIVALEKADPKRIQSLKKLCDKVIFPESKGTASDYLFRCGAGLESFSLSYDGKVRLCSSLNHPSCTYELMRGNLKEAWDDFIPRVRGMGSDNPEFLNKCHVCPIINFCMYCPAIGNLETGKMDQPSKYFCRLAHKRVESIKKALTK